MRPDRRSVLAAALALGGAVATPAALARTADLGGPETLTLFDAQEPAARAFAEAQAGRSVAIEGDRIRLARRVFAEDAPARLRVIGRHADLLLLSEAAREAGYRAVATDSLPGASGLFLWTARRQA